MNNLFLPAYWVLFLMLWRMSYEVANVPSTTSAEKSYLLDTVSKEDRLTSAEKEWAAKATQKYADTQEKKWQRWNEAMFERLN
jgi:hypothetical protein